MEAGVDVLIEKPLTATLREANELVTCAATHNRIAQAGHLERFNPAVRATVPLIRKPMFFEVHRLSVFTPRSLDVDVVLDLMIHDLDVVLSFVQTSVKEIRAVGIIILSGKVDIANVRVEFESGCVANRTASRVSTERVRKLRFFQAGQYISIDYGRQDVLMFSVAEPAVEAASQVSIRRSRSPSPRSAPRSRFWPRSSHSSTPSLSARCPLSRSMMDEKRSPSRWKFSPKFDVTLVASASPGSLAEHKLEIGRHQDPGPIAVTHVLTSHAGKNATIDDNAAAPTVYVSLRFARYMTPGRMLVYRITQMHPMLYELRCERTTQRIRNQITQPRRLFAALN